METLAKDRKKKVLAIIDGKEGKTFWRHIGAAFVNNDTSITVYLDLLPISGKLQIRDWEDQPPEWRRGGARGALPPPPEQRLLPEPQHVDGDSPF
jgi:hypothetical protein